MGTLDQASINKALRFLKEAEPFTLVLQANVTGGTKFFLDSILTKETVLVIPSRVPREVSKYSTMEAEEVLHLSHKGESMACGYLELLKALKGCDFKKVFLNHVWGIPLDFLKELFAMQKQYISVSHDFTWIIDRIQPSADELADPSVARNHQLEAFHAQIDMKFQHEATMSCFQRFAKFRSLEVVPMPDFHESSSQIEASDDLAMASLGDISWIKGGDSIVNVSKVHQNTADDLEIGFRSLSFVFGLEESRRDPLKAPLLEDKRGISNWVRGVWANWSITSRSRIASEVPSCSYRQKARS